MYVKKVSIFLFSCIPWTHDSFAVNFSVLITNYKATMQLFNILVLYQIYALLLSNTLTCKTLLHLLYFSTFPISHSLFRENSKYDAEFFIYFSKLVCRETFKEYQIIQDCFFAILRLPFSQSGGMSLVIYLASNDLHDSLSHHNICSTTLKLLIKFQFVIE